MLGCKTLLRTVLTVGLAAGFAAGAAAQTPCPPGSPALTSSPPTAPAPAQPPPVPQVTQQQLQQVQQYVPGMTLQELQDSLEYGSYMIPPVTFDVLLQRLQAQASQQAQTSQQAGSQAPAQPAPNPLQAIPTSNRVLIYNDLNQPPNQFGALDACGNPLHAQFTITFVGTQGTSQTYNMDSYYAGQEWLRTSGITQTVLPPYAAPYSGTAISANVNGGPTVFQHGPIDLLNIPISTSIGTIIAVVLDTGNSGYAVPWNIDKIVAGGRTFSFVNATGPIQTRYSGHYVLGSGNGDYHVSRPATWDANVAVEQCSFIHTNGSGVLLPPDMSFGDSGTYRLLNGNAQTMAANCPDTYVRPVWRSLYFEPTQNGFTKHVTVRLQLGNFTGEFDTGPIISVALTGPSGTSGSQQTDGTLAFGHEFVTFAVPGDFQVTGLNLALVNPQANAAPVQVTAAGMVVEEGLAPEVPIQDTASLSAAAPTATMKLYGASAVFDPAALQDPTAVADLQARTPDAIFDALATTPDELAAINGFRTFSDTNNALVNYFPSSAMILQSGHLFDTWFLQSNDETLQDADLLGPADAYFAQTPAPPGADVWLNDVRNKLQDMIDDRLLALQYLDTLVDMANSANTTNDTETNLATLNLETSTPIASCSGVPSPEDETGTFLDVTNAAFGLIAALPGPQSTALNFLGSILSAASDIESVTGGSSSPVMPPPPPPPCDAGAAVNSLFQTTLSDLNMEVGAQITNLANSINMLRPLVVRDANLLQAFKNSRVAQQAGLTAGGSGTDLVPMDVQNQYQVTTALEIRQIFATALLPIRTVIYGQPISIMYDQNSSTGLPDVLAPQAPLTSLFPPKQNWPTMQNAAYTDVCGQSVGCDDHVLAFSAALVLDQYNPPGITSYVVRPWFHEWRLAYWEGGANPPTTVTADVWTNYLSPVFSTDDVFALLSPTAGRMLIGEWQYQCNYNSTVYVEATVTPEGSTPAEYPDLRGICNVQSASSWGPGSDAILLYPMPAWQNGTITDAFTVGSGQCDSDCSIPPLPTITASRSIVKWNTGVWSGSLPGVLGSPPTWVTGSAWTGSTINFAMHQYADPTFVGPLLPTAWWRLH